MAKERIPINPDVLAWALAERGMSADGLAAALKVQPEDVEQWLSGDLRPSKGEWSKIAEKLKRPKSVFLLPEPPDTSVPPSLRTAAGRNSHELGPDERLQVRRARRLQRYLSALLSESGEAVIQIPPVSTSSDHEESGQILRRWLAVSVEAQLSWDSASEARRAWSSALEARGVIVMQLQMGRKGMRGFSLEDDHAPVVAVNTAENNEARTFTMMHELAHLASRSESACAFPPNRRSPLRSVETWCDAVSAAVLMPKADVRSVVQRLLAGPRAPQGDLALARRVAGKFGTSLRASGLRLMELQLAGDDLFSVIEEAYPNRDRQKPSGGPVGGGMGAPERRLNELGVRASAALLAGYRRRRITERDARDLLRLDGPELSDLRSMVASHE